MHDKKHSAISVISALVAILRKIEFGNTFSNSGVEPKPATKTDDVEILWDILIYSCGAEIVTAVEQGNRSGMVGIDQKSKTVTVIECSCPWFTNTDRKDKEKT